MSTVSYDVLENVIDYSKAFNMPAEKPQSLLEEVRTGAPLKATSFHWWEEDRAPVETTLSAEHAIAGVYAMTDITPFVKGSLFKVGALTVSVDSISGSNVTGTVIDGADAIIAVDTAVYLIGNAQPESSSGQEVARHDKKKVYNYTQIMRETYTVSETQMAVDKEVGQQEMTEGVASIITRFRDYSSGMLWSPIQVDAPNNSIARVAGGVPFFANANGTKLTGALNAANISTFAETLYNNVGAKPKEIWINPANQATFSDMDASTQRRDQESVLRGAYAEKFVTKQGKQFLIKTDVNIPLDKAYFMNSTDIMFRVLRPLTSKPVATDDDSAKVAVVTEFSVEVNPSSQMGIFTIA